MAESVPVRCVVLGAGLRGRQVYGRHALEHPERLRVVALAEPLAERREAMAREHGLAADAAFADWRELLERPQWAELGRCVYRCDNDVADHQVVAVEFEGGVTGSFAVHGHATRECRTLRITGSAGELRGNLESGEIEISRHGAFEVERRRLEQSPLGHFGGDLGLLAHVIEAVRGGGQGDARASGRTALESHLLGFAAEQARESGSVVDVRAFGRALVAGGAP